MTDLELVKACAEAIGYQVVRVISNDKGGYPVCFVGNKEIGYDPLTDDGQMAQLVKRFKLGMYWVDGKHNMWVVHGSHRPNGENADLNRAVCECVAAIKK